MKEMNECDVNDYTIKWHYTMTLTNQSKMEDEWILIQNNKWL